MTVGAPRGDARVRESLILGGGLAGAMAGLRLARAGRDVVLVEREPGAQHKVCGEFLSPEATEYLRQAGVDPVGLGAAAIERVRVSVKNRMVETELPFRALSVSRRVLDEALLARAEQAGCQVRRGVAVHRLSRCGAGWAAQQSNGEAVLGRDVFLATGKHDLRGWKRPNGVQGGLVGFKLHWRLATPQTETLRGFMDLFLFRGGYGGLALVEGDTANLCLVVVRSELVAAGGWQGLFARLCAENALIAERLSEARPLWGKPLAISPIPYGYVCDTEDELWPVGDQAAVIPSFTGDGMAIALHSGAMAAEIYLSGGSPHDYRRELRNQLSCGMRVATLMSRAMVSRGGQNVAPWMIPLLPHPISWIARSTRIPEAALRPVFSR